MFPVSIALLLPLRAQQDSPVAVTLGFLIIFGPLIFFILQFGWKTRNNHLWEAGIFPSNLKFTRDHLMEAYICLGARIIQMDPHESGQKIIYMNKYFNTYFKNSNYNFSESISYSFSHPIRVKTVTTWMNRNFERKDQKMQVLYFLAGISMIDGIMNKREYHMIEVLGEYLQLSPADVRSVFAMYERRHEEKREETKTYSSKNMTRICCDILGVSEHAKMDEIKKAYRKLVKVHHPDRFMNESTEQQHIAEERFLEIQKAYEYLEKIKP